MPEPAQIAKAELWELTASGNNKPGSRVVVQFNPESLKVSFANQLVPPENAGGDRDRARDQAESAGLQFVGKGTSKLALQLWFDATAPLPEGALEGNARTTDDVRKLTKRVAYFITPQNSQNPRYADKQVPPAVRFRWGSFQFDGIIEAIEESLEFFSPDGRPLRAGVSLSLTQQSIKFGEILASSSGAGAGGRPVAPGTKPLSQASRGDSIQSLAAGVGRSDDWQAIATANAIENPRFLPPGLLLNLNVS